MRRHLLSLLAVLIVVLSAVAIYYYFWAQHVIFEKNETASSLRYKAASSAANIRSARPSLGPGSGADLPFVHGVSGRGRKSGAKEVSFTNYESSDGSKVRANLETYGSAFLAEREFKSMLHKSSEVLERGSKRDPNGRVLGERAALRRHEEKGKMPFVVVWRDRDELYVLESNSLQKVLALEEYLYPEKPNKHFAR